MASVPRAAAVTSRATLFMAALPANLALPDAKGAIRQRRWAGRAGHAGEASDGPCDAVGAAARAPTRIAA